MRHVYILHTYVYIYRERGGDRERERERDRHWVRERWKDRQESVVRGTGWSMTKGGSKRKKRKADEHVLSFIQNVRD